MVSVCMLAGMAHIPVVLVGPYAEADCMALCLALLAWEVAASVVLFAPYFAGHHILLSLAVLVVAVSSRWSLAADQAAWEDLEPLSMVVLHQS